EGGGVETPSLPLWPCGAEKGKVYGGSTSHNAPPLALSRFLRRTFVSPLSLASLASSPAGRAKCTSVNREKLCGKANFFAALPYHKLCRHQRACSWATKSSKCNRRIKENFSRGFPAQAFSWAGID